MATEHTRRGSQPKFKVFETKNGPIKAAIDASGPALAMFSVRTRNRIVRGAVARAAELWRIVFLPKRFTQYAYAFLHYHVSQEWNRKKQKLAASGGLNTDQPTPLVYTGTMRDVATNNSRATAVATQNKARAIIKVPYGHGVLPQITAIFKTIPKHEITRMAEEVAKAIHDLMDDEMGDRQPIQPRLMAPMTMRNPGTFNQRDVG